MQLPAIPECTAAHCGCLHQERRTCFTALFSSVSSRPAKTRLNWLGSTICCQLTEDGSASEEKVSASTQPNNARGPERTRRCRSALATKHSSTNVPSRLTQRLRDGGRSECKSECKSSGQGRQGSSDHTAHHNSVVPRLGAAEALHPTCDLCCDCEERSSLFGDDD